MTTFTARRTGGTGDPVGAADIAARLGVRAETAATWRHRGLLPEPDWTVSGSPVWDWSQIAEWAAETDRMPSPMVLTVRQPWAWAICAGHQDVENRDGYTDYQGLLLIHAGTRSDPLGYPALDDRGITVPDHEDFGALIGSVTLLDVVPSSSSPRWSEGSYAWLLRGGRLFDRPFPQRGRQGLTAAPAAVLKQLGYAP